MTTEQILTDEEVQGILSRVYNYPLSQIHPRDIRAWRAIEQAVLQSPEMQALRKDAARYQEIRNRLTGASYDPAFFDDLFKAGCIGHPEEVDEEIDAAMEQQK